MRTTADKRAVIMERPGKEAVKIVRESAGEFSVSTAGPDGVWSKKRSFGIDTPFGAWLQSTFARSQPMQYLRMPR